MIQIFSKKMARNSSVVTMRKPVNHVIKTFNDSSAIIMFTKLSDVYATVFHRYERDFDIIPENLGKRTF